MIKPTNEIYEGINLLQYLTFGLIGLIANILKHLNVNLNVKRISFVALLLSGITMLCIATIIAAALDFYKIDWRLMMLCSFIIGWQGKKFMIFLELVGKKFISKKLDIDITEEVNEKVSE